MAGIEFHSNNFGSWRALGTKAPMMAKRLACDKRVALWVCCVFSDGEPYYVVDEFKP